MYSIHYYVIIYFFTKKLYIVAYRFINIYCYKTLVTRHLLQDTFFT